MKKVLYISFTDLSASASSGSELRPQKMLEALQDTGSEIRFVDGVQNDRAARLRAYQIASAWLKDWKPDLCYIEPPSGPLFYKCDRALIRKIYRLGIPVGLFYRDAYWRFPKMIFSPDREKKIIPALKRIVIAWMQRRDWNLYKRCCRKIYFPTKLMASYFDCKQIGVLPPGCAIIDIPAPAPGIPKAIYVGGATERYGLPLLLDAAAEANRNEQRFKLCVVCQKQGWLSFLDRFPRFSEDTPWLELYYINSGERLEKLYSECSFSIIPLKKNLYHDFAFPVKLAEYLSHLLPVISTDCEETKRFVERERIGLIAKDTVPEFAAALSQMAENAALRDEFRANCITAREQNTWLRRALTVLEDLSGDG